MRTIVDILDILNLMGYNSRDIKINDDCNGIVFIRIVSSRRLTQHQINYIQWNKPIRLTLDIGIRIFGIPIQEVVIK